MQKNGFGILLAYLLVVVVCLQLAYYYPEAKELFSQLPMFSDPNITVMQSSSMLQLQLANEYDGKKIVILINGQARGTLNGGNLTLVVQQGDIIEAETDYPQPINLVVRSTDSSVLVPKAGQGLLVQTGRTVLCRVLISPR